MNMAPVGRHPYIWPIRPGFLGRFGPVIHRSAKKRVLGVDFRIGRDL